MLTTDWLSGFFRRGVACAGILVAACPAPLPEGKCSEEQACPDGFMCAFEQDDAIGRCLRPATAGADAAVLDAGADAAVMDAGGDAGSIADAGGVDHVALDAPGQDAAQDAGTVDASPPSHLPPGLLPGTSVGSMTSSGHRMLLGVGAQRPAGQAADDNHKLTLFPLR